MTKAGRALQKHRDRQGNIFLKATGTPTVKNEQTQMIVDSILNDQNKQSHPNQQADSQKSLILYQKMEKVYAIVKMVN